MIRSPSRRRPGAVVLALLATLLAAGCVRAGAEPPGPGPATVADFYAQRLSWGPCDGFARSDTDRRGFAGPAFACAYLAVPLDYDRPAGPSARIGVLRRLAADPAARVGALVINPGGPGASGMSAAAALALRLAVSELTTRFDLVGFDPRGVGASEPALVCRTAAERDTDRADLDTDTSPAGTAAAEAEERLFAGRCAERGGVDLLAHLGSRDVARDMDVLRAALGEPRLTYLGYSYGTRIGTEYLAQFPRNVRAMVLDGAVDPSRPPGDALVAQARGFERAFTAFASWCARQAGCPLGVDPDAGFRSLVDPLGPAPVAADRGRQLGQSDAVTATIQALYSPQLWDTLREGLVDLGAGSGESLLALADSYYDRRDDGSYSAAADVLAAVHCVDDVRQVDPAEIAGTDARVRAAAPFLDDGSPPSPARGACAFWPVPAAAPLARPVVGSPAVVVVSTTGDPATPYENGVRLAAGLGARLVTVEGEQHTASLAGTECVDGPVTRYLVDPSRLPAEGLRCTAR